MTDLPAFDRIMWRGKTLAAMSEDELRSALRDCWVERKARAQPTPPPKSDHEAIRAKMGKLTETFDKVFGKL